MVRMLLMRAGLAAATVLLAAVPAWADAIDGDWCTDTGRHLSIKGPTIVTPGGTAMKGQYSRHSFRYIAPAGEPGAGQDVWMQLLSETAMRSRIGAESAWESWRRCKPETIS